MITVAEIRDVQQHNDWSGLQLYAWIGDLLGAQSSDRLARKYRGLKLDKLLEHEEVRELLEAPLLESSSMRIKLENCEDDDGSAWVYCGCQFLARHDQTVAGSRWECPGDRDVAYACISDHPGLVQELEREGYIVNADEYSPPDGVL